MAKWKAIAIVFIIISLLEGAFIWMAYDYGSDIIELENECSVNVCSEYPSYFFDATEQMCYCYQGEDIVKMEYLKR